MNNININIVNGNWNDGECLSILFDNKDIRIEHVFMPSKSSPHEFWYDSFEDEWGLVISGNITFQYHEVDFREETYCKGQQFYMPRHQKHRIVITSLDCVVLCVFIKSKGV